LNIKNKVIPVYPVLIAIFPVLSLLGRNIQEVYPGVAIPPMGMILLGTLLVWAAWRMVGCSWQKSAFLTTWVLLLFFTYGHVYTALKIPGWAVARHAILLPLWAILWLGGSAVIWKFLRPGKQLTMVMNTISVFLLLVPVFQIGSYTFRTWQARRDVSATSTVQASTAVLTPPDELPDIYVIVLDSHERTDVLKETYGLDNQPFVDSLTELGFYVAPCSMSNYAYTPLSISSILNMNYIDQMGEWFDPQGQDRTPLFELVKHNAVRLNLEALGYRSVSMVSYQPLAWEDADEYYSTDPSSLASFQQSGQISQFEQLVWQTTAVKVLLDHPIRQSRVAAIPDGHPYADHILQQWYIFDQLGKMPAVRGPKLVFVHINIPHPPYTFHADGSLIQDPPPLPWIEPIAWDQYLGYYAGQVQYVDAQILPILQKIIEESVADPVILLFGDHGADSANRLAILNAYYVPESVKDDLYPSISPVNSFRVIFNGMFGTDFERLEDRSYLSDQAEIYQFTPYGETMPGCLP